MKWTSWDGRGDGKIHESRLIDCLRQHIGQMAEAFWNGVDLRKHRKTDKTPEAMQVVSGVLCQGRFAMLLRYCAVFTRRFPMGSGRTAL